MVAVIVAVGVVVNHNSTQPQPNITLVGLDKKMTLHTITHPPPPPPHKLNFDKTLNVVSWEHLEQIPTIQLTFVQATFVQATFVHGTFVHIRNISAVTDLILTKL